MCYNIIGDCMIEINDLEKHKKCRVWLNEKPDIYYNAQDIIVENFDANMSVSQNKRITIEILLPRNASYYGLLGAEFIPDNSGMTTVRIAVSDCENNIFENHMSYNFEKVICGIPREYGNSVLNYIKANIEKINLPSGKLNFNIGAHGIIGSSCSVFGVLSGIVLMLLQIDFDDNQKIKQEVMNNI